MGIRRIFRITGILLLSGLTLLLVLIGSIQIQQHIFRAHAERLYGEIMSLQLLKTPGSDVERILSHWGNSLHRAGDCASGNCTLRVGVIAVAWPARYDFFTRRWWLVEHYPSIGGRMGTYGADLAIVNGVVARKSFYVDMQNISAADALGKRYWYSRTGLIQSLSSFRGYVSFECGRPNPAHPEYCVTNAFDCWKECTTENVYFTAFASPEDVARLTRFNFDCMTRWSPCEHVSDILPAASEEYEAEYKKRAALPRAAREEADNAWLNQEWLLAREAENVVIADVLSIREKQQFAIRYWEVRLRLVERLKGARDWKRGNLRDMPAAVDFPMGPPEALATIHAGTRFLVMYDWPSPAKAFGIDPNGVQLLNDANLAAVRFGIARDYEAGMPTTHW